MVAVNPDVVEDVVEEVASRSAEWVAVVFVVTGGIVTDDSYAETGGRSDWMYVWDALARGYYCWISCWRFHIRSEIAGW